MTSCAASAFANKRYSKFLAPSEATFGSQKTFVREVAVTRLEIA
jgi:hypothetical protein